MYFPGNGPVSGNVLRVLVFSTFRVENPHLEAFLSFV